MKMNGLNVFLITNSILVALVVGFFNLRLDNSQLPVEAILKAPHSDKFTQPLAFSQDGNYFVQLAHPTSNSKVSIFIAPSATKPVSEQFFDLIRQYQPDTPNPLDSDITRFVRAQFDPRRADLTNSPELAGISWKQLVVKNKAHYLLSIFQTELGQVAVVAFNPNEPVPDRVALDLLENFPALSKH